MANLNNPHGLRPLGINLAGGAPYFEQLSKLASYATAIFQYDAVNRVSGGAIQASATPGTTTYTGVAMNYGAASTATDHLVCTDPTALYEAQEDGSAGIAAADLGLNANLVLTAGNTLTKISKHQIAGSTKAVTSTLDVHLLSLLAVPDNAFGNNARIEFVFNKHRYAPGVAGV